MEYDNLERLLRANTTHAYVSAPAFDLSSGLVAKDTPTLYAFGTHEGIERVSAELPDCTVRANTYPAQRAPIDLLDFISRLPSRGEALPNEAAFKKLYGLLTLTVPVGAKAIDRSISTYRNQA